MLENIFPVNPLGNALGVLTPMFVNQGPASLLV